jgi:hypothetical protein
MWVKLVTVSVLIVNTSKAMIDIMLKLSEMGNHFLKFLTNLHHLTHYTLDLIMFFHSDSDLFEVRAFITAIISQIIKSNV